MKLVKKSSNRKLSRDKSCHATYRKVGETCSTTCALLNSGCYAQRSFVGMVQSKLKNHEIIEKDIFSNLDNNSNIRLMVSGDVLSKGKIDKKLQKLVLNESKRLNMWGYTHSWSLTSPGAYNNVLLASVDSVEEQKIAESKGWRTARVIPSPEDKMDNEVLCPFDAAIKKGIKIADIKTSCVECKMCFKDKKFNIAFLKH